MATAPIALAASIASAGEIINPDFLSASMKR